MGGPISDCDLLPVPLAMIEVELGLVLVEGFGLDGHNIEDHPSGDELVEGFH